MAERINQTTINLDKDIKNKLQELGNSYDFNSWDDFMLYTIELLKQDRPGIQG